MSRQVPGSDTLALSNTPGDVSRFGETYFSAISRHERLYYCCKDPRDTTTTPVVSENSITLSFVPFAATSPSEIAIGGRRRAPMDSVIHARSGDVATWPYRPTNALALFRISS